ncbi:hypothetical protein DRO69_10460 [Candidatus Bathyarchaeota archaeon]|nr:MAG: hypothetical protein DRO69_10460 [Candidatus Bathyarchaeota archaeon]
MSLLTKNLAVGIIAGLTIGLILGYIVTPKGVDPSEFERQINELEEQIENLQGQLESKDEQISYLQSQIADQNDKISILQSQAKTKDAQISNLQSQISDLTNDLNELQKSYDSLLHEYNSLKDSYSSLLNTLNIIDAKDLHRVENFTINSGETLRYEYDVGYGIIWIIEFSLNIHYSGTRWEWSIGWRQGEQGGLVSAGGTTIEQKISSVSGTVSTDIFDEGDALFIRTNIDTSVSYFSHAGSGRLLKNP